METSLSSSQVANAAEISLRQIQWWDEKGVVRVRKQGHARRFSRLDAMLFAIAGHLRRRNVSLQRLRSTMPTIRRLLLQQPGYTGTYLVFTSKPAIVRQAQLIQTLSTTNVAGLVLDLHKIAEIVDSVSENA